jgi:hypothetical protein
VSAGYAAHFEGLNADKLFAIEDERNECDDVRAYVEGLLIILAEWRRQLAGQSFGRAEFERALNATREAWLQWSFRCIGNEWLPESFDLPPRRAGGQR